MYSKGNDEGDHLKAMTGLEALSIRNVSRKCGFTWLCTFQWEAEGGDVTLEVWRDHMRRGTIGFPAKLCGLSDFDYERLYTAK